GRASATGNFAYFERLYSRTGPEETCVVQTPFGIGNSLMTRATLGEAPFDISANETGGEDDALFAHMQNAGARFAWAHDAWVIEHVEEARLTPRHALKRAFAYGQGPSELAFVARDYASLMRHMVVGAAQASVYGVAAGASFIAQNDNALPLADRAMRGLGKVLWFRPQKFYGSAQPT
ncbi:MAG: glycosyltransferase family 2 protein, partial [Caulobacterales bacterium]